MDDLNRQEKLNGKRSSVGHTNHAERRGEERTKCFVQARAVVSIDTRHVYGGEGTIANISGTGLLFEFRDKPDFDNLIPNNAEVDIHLTLGPDFDKEMTMKGRVMWTKYAGKTRFGIRLLDPDASLLLSLFS